MKGFMKLPLFFSRFVGSDGSLDELITRLGAKPSCTDHYASHSRSNIQQQHNAEVSRYQRVR